MPVKSLLGATESVADTVSKQTFVDKLENISDMSVADVISTATHGIITIAFKLVIALFIFLIGRWIIRRIRRVLLRVMEKREIDISLRAFLLSLVSISMFLFLIIIIIGILGIDTTSFVALFASAGLAIGMALSGTLQNFAGGVIILILKPFRVGDFVETQGQTGTIKEIQLFNTVMNTPDNKMIMVPNGGIATGIINNYSREDHRRVDWTFGIAYGDDYDKAKSVIGSILENDERVHKDPAYFIALNSLGNSSVNIVVRAWVDTSEYWNLYFHVNESVYKTFAKEGLNIPFPQMDVHLISPDKPKV